MSTTTAAPATPITPRTLTSTGVVVIRSAIGIASLIGLVLFVYFASQQVGYKEANVGAMFAVGAIGFSIIAGLYVLVGVIVGWLHRWTGWVGLALLVSGFVLTILLFTAWGGTLGTFGQGWHGLVIGALLLITGTTIVLPTNRR